MTNPTPKAPNEQARIELPGGWYVAHIVESSSCRSTDAWYLHDPKNRELSGPWSKELAEKFAAAMNTPPQTNGQAGDGELREALAAIEFNQTEGRDGKMIGWLRLRPDASKNRGGVQVTFQEPEMLDALQKWHDQKAKALATPAPAAGLPVVERIDDATLQHFANAKLGDAPKRAPLPAAIPAPTVTGWRLIGSAPYDGSRFLAVGEDNEPIIVWWSERLKDWCSMYDVKSCNPTHWMPLPAAPQKEEA